MKKLIFFLFVILLSGTGLSAQKTSPAAQNATISDPEIRAATEALTLKYSLNADQAKQMYTIQLRKAKNTAQIAAFQNADPALYRAKMQSIQKGTIASIRRILQSKEQVDLYQKTQTDLRVLRNKKQKEMSVNGASKADIETALLAIYAE